METSTRALASELPANRAERTRSEMAALAQTGTFVRVPNDYLATDADIAALQSDKTAVTAALVKRGAVHLDRQEWVQSLADEDAALAIDPANASAHAVRALALAVQGDGKAVEASDRAIALDNKQVLAWRAKGLIALRQGRSADAEPAFSHALDLDDKDQTALVGRATARLSLGRYAESLADLDAVLAVVPAIKIRVLRAAALAGLGRKEEALAEADRAVEGEPKDREVRKARAEIRTNLGRRASAIEDYDLLIAQAPTADLYLARAPLWSSTDRAKRDADVQAALRLEPKSVSALAMHAAIGIEAADFRGAQADIARLEQIDAESLAVYELRLQLLQKQGHPREALKVVDGYLAKHPKDAKALNERCWTKATLNIEIETAVADCDASLKLAPNNAATLDSRAFARLRMGAIDAAIADYDAALKFSPEQSASLYGRAIARARRGDDAAARADLAEARKLSPDIDQRFAGFGIQMPTNLAGSSQETSQGQRN